MLQAAARATRRCAHQCRKFASSRTKQRGPEGGLRESHTWTVSLNRREEKRGGMCRVRKHGAGRRMVHSVAEVYARKGLVRRRKSVHQQGPSQLVSRCLLLIQAQQRGYEDEGRGSVRMLGRGCNGPRMLSQAQKAAIGVTMTWCESSADKSSAPAYRTGRWSSHGHSTKTSNEGLWHRHHGLPVRGERSRVAGT